MLESIVVFVYAIVLLVLTHSFPLLNEYLFILKTKYTLSLMLKYAAINLGVRVR